MPFGTHHIVGDVPELPSEDVDDAVVEEEPAVETQEEPAVEEPVEEYIIGTPVFVKAPDVSGGCPQELASLCKSVPEPCTILVVKPEHVLVAECELDRLGRKNVKVQLDPRPKGNHPTWTR